MSTAAKRQVAALMSKSIEASDDLRKSVGVMAKVLSEVLSDMHGGNWQIQINHEHAYVLIVQRQDRRARS